MCAYAQWIPLSHQRRNTAVADSRAGPGASLLKYVGQEGRDPPGVTHRRNLNLKATMNKTSEQTPDQPPRGVTGEEGVDKAKAGEW